MPLCEECQIRINHRTFSLQRALATYISHTTCRPLTLQCKAIFTRNHISSFHRVWHITLHTLLHLLRHLLIVAHLRHYNITPCSLQLIKVDNEVGNSRILWIYHQSNPIAHLQCAKHLLVASSVYYIIVFRVATIIRQQHHYRVCASFARQTVNRFVARQLQFIVEVSFLNLHFILVTTSSQSHRSNARKYKCLYLHICFSLSYAKILQR